MTKVIIFDLDGVLVDSKEIHFNALNTALRKINVDYVISSSEQESTYEGLTTRAKLEILTEQKGLPKDMHEMIWRNKQVYSAGMFSVVKMDMGLVKLFKTIKESGIKIAVASNSIRDTLDSCLMAMGVFKFIDYSLSNEDVSNPKPDPEIYLKCLEHFEISADDAVVFEDSPIGRQSAYASGIKVIEVDSRSDLTPELIHDTIKYLVEKEKN